METAHLDYLREHLRILSSFYGLLQLFDGVTPYRLEMQAKLSVGGCRDLYQFWDDRLAWQLASETDFVLQAELSTENHDVFLKQPETPSDEE